MAEDDAGPATQEQATPKRPSQQTPQRLFTKDFVLAIFINLLITTVFFVLVTGLAVYAASEFGTGETASGFAASAFVVGALCARFFAGKWVNTLGRRITLILCLAVYTLAAILYPLAHTFELLIGLRLIHGMALGFGQTALTAAVFDLIPRHRRGEGSGYYLLANSLPPALGPLIAIQLTEAYGFQSMFTTVTIISAVAFLLAVFIEVPEIRPTGVRLRERLMLSPRDVLEPKVLPIALVAMLLGISFASVMTFLNGYAQSQGMQNAASIYFVVYSVAMLIARLFMGKMQDRFGDNAVIYPALSSFLVSMVLLTWSPNESLLILAGVLAGFGFGSMLPALQAMIASKLRTHRISIGVSTFFILMDTGFGFAPLFLGPFVEAWGYQMMYAACCGVVVLTVALYWLVHGRYSVRRGLARKRTHNWVNDATDIMPYVRK